MAVIQTGLLYVKIFIFFAVVLNESWSPSLAAVTCLCGMKARVYLCAAEVEIEEEREERM